MNKKTDTMNNKTNEPRCTCRKGKVPVITLVTATGHEDHCDISKAYFEKGKDLVSGNRLRQTKENGGMRDG